jgi:hypothetical protein
MLSLKILSHDTLSRLNDDELKKHCMEVRSKINRSQRINKDSKELEIYFCYILRELETRQFVQRR